MITEKELLAEFAELFKNPPKLRLEEVDGIIVLSADEEPEEENISRIRYARSIFEMLSSRVPIIFSGVAEEKEYAIELMRKLGVPNDSIHFQDCGRRGIANTKTQFETIPQDPLTKSLSRMVVVTSTYNIPRARRTAGKYLPSRVVFVVLADPTDIRLYNQAIRMIGEIERILKYSARGDILVNPRD